MDCMEEKGGNADRTIKETCDLAINQLMQSLQRFTETLRQTFERLRRESVGGSKDICESGRRRRTKHGGNITPVTQAKAKANIKWREKYRPP